ncbi:MAG: EVE domain-containing protein [Kiritimatiellia bacterium]
MRNYQARNFMRDDMRPGDLVLFYRSNAEPSGVAGLGRILGGPLPDPTQFDPASDYVDPKARPEAPTWILREVGFVLRFPRVVALGELRTNPALAGMLVIKKGMRLSIQPVRMADAREICRMAGVDLPEEFRGGQ